VRFGKKKFEHLGITGRRPVKLKEERWGRWDGKIGWEKMSTGKGYYCELQNMLQRIAARDLSRIHEEQIPRGDVQKFPKAAKRKARTGDNT